MHAEAFQRYSEPRDEGLGRAVALAIALHIAIALVFVLASFFSWQRDTTSAAGLPVMEASLEVSSAEARIAQRAMDAASDLEPLPQPIEEVAEEDTVPPPQPVPEPMPQDSPVPRQQVAQERVPVPDTVDQDRASALAISQEKARREQEEKRRQEQIDLTEQKRVQEAQKQQRLAKQQEEADKQKKLAEQERQKAARLAEIRAERAKLDRDKKLAEQKLRQVSELRARNASASANSAQYGGQDAAAGGPSQGDWVGAMVAAIEQRWIRPSSVAPGMICPIRIKMLPGGDVMSAEVLPSCPYDEAARDSVERAVRAASPLPYSGYERVAARDFVVRFQPSR
jgi:colicin import membrane protein